MATDFVFALNPSTAPPLRLAKGSERAPSFSFLSPRNLLHFLTAPFILRNIHNAFVTVSRLYLSLSSMDGHIYIVHAHAWESKPKRDYKKRGRESKGSYRKSKRGLPWSAKYGSPCHSPFPITAQLFLLISPSMRRMYMKRLIMSKYRLTAAQMYSSTGKR
jgi:hypothetical protein